MYKSRYFHRLHSFDIHKQMVHRDRAMSIFFTHGILATYGWKEKERPSWTPATKGRYILNIEGEYLLQVLQHYYSRLKAKKRRDERFNYNYNKYKKDDN